MTNEKNLELAKLLYDNYCIGVGGVAFNGDKLPTAEEFFNDSTNEKQANAWRGAAAASNTFFEVNPDCITDGQLRQKADKWDDLGDDIAKCYLDEQGNVKPENDEQDDLGYIGELAATAFGWL